ncbi:3D domain-containing protein [Deinococcus multiflagellatus]|uniref:3D domain-containing protein n=1 Tax=Deinococcus multiflagellatus TaxID=1656887 RepID=A0ABW1ZMV4_9DEIO|nr:3D domain-containing protein [Deinococcus multiflagellatus]MBZ9715125.1 3D domain-containing protein [Deinococcus multiflagellatus]
MSQRPLNWIRAAAFVLLGTAGATPALPASTVASDAVRDALTVRPAASPAPQQAAQNRAAAIAQAQQPSQPVALTPVRGRSAVARSTAYNSLPSQTDGSPYITATGTRTRPGVIALSRDLLRLFPYGTRVMIEDLSGRYSNMLRGRVFIVEDTMAARKTNSVDIWMPTRTEALNWGARQIRITAIR